MKKNLYRDGDSVAIIIPLPIRQEYGIKTSDCPLPVNIKEVEGGLFIELPRLNKESGVK